MRFSDFLFEVSKEKTRFLLIDRIKRKSDFMKFLEFLQGPYYSGVILELIVSLKYGEYLSNFLYDCYRSNLKSFLNFPVIHSFIDEKLLAFISNLGFDAVIVEPNPSLAKLIRKYELGMICYGYIRGEDRENELFLENLEKIDHDGIFTLQANKQTIEDLKKLFKKVVINLGEVKGDIEVDVFKDRA